MAWGKAGSTTLSSSGDNIDVTGFADNNFIIYLNHNIPTGSMTDQIRFDGNSGSNYAFRYNNNGTSESTLINQCNASYLGWTTNTNQSFSIGYIVNISTEEKIGINHSTDNHCGTGAGTATNRRETVFKLADTTNSIDEVNVFNSHTGSFDTCSNLTVLGSDLTPTAAVPALGANLQLGSRFEETDTRKMYNLNDPGTNVLYECATNQCNTSGHGSVVFIGCNATYATLFSRITATNTTHPHPAVNVDTPNKAFSCSDPWTIELTFKESYTIPSGSTITYNSYNNGQGARLKYLDFQVYTGSTWENITGTITNPNHSDGDVETLSGRWVKYMTSTTTTEKTGTKFRVRMWDSWDNYVANGRHYIGGIELKTTIGNIEWEAI